MRPEGRVRVGLALGGGAVRGLAHIGVLTVLEREGIPIDCVAGTSVGSVVGAAYCAGLDSGQMKEIAAQMGWRKIARPALSSKGFISFEKLERWLVDILGDLDFSELAIPFASVATDIESGEPVALRRGRVAAAVRASCSVPGIVTPVWMNGQPLVDGFASDNLPVAAVRELGADYVIAVDICLPSFRRRLGPLGVAFGAVENMARRVGDGLAETDCLITPALAGSSYVRFSQRAALFERGVRAAEEKLPLIQAALQSPSPT